MRTTGFGLWEQDVDNLGDGLSGAQNSPLRYQALIPLAHPVEYVLPVMAIFLVGVILARLVTGLRDIF
jgi:hypothetical protein